MVENAKVSKIQMRHFEWTKVHHKCQNSVTRQVIYIGHKLFENAQIGKFKCDILSNFQTMYNYKCFPYFWADFFGRKRIIYLVIKLEPFQFCLLLNSIRYLAVCERSPCQWADEVSI